jgi:proton-translocating NAD(P)+ transhydrogenase subunit alpha
MADLGAHAIREPLLAARASARRLRAPEGPVNATGGMRIFVPREIAESESRVALVPETVSRLVQSGLALDIESGAGERAYFLDEGYRAAGATLVTDVRAAYAGADAVLKVREPLPHPTLGAHEADLLREGSLFISFLSPALNADLIARLASRRVAAFAMELIPRITRAQKMDALSSMSTVAGYKATLLAANHLGKFFPLLMTAAGTIPPARVFVLGAGVAGLTAIATARRLGAVVEAFDVRPAAREEVQSLGATFVGSAMEEAVAEGGYAKELPEEHQRKERELIREHLRGADAAITSAAIPGRRAPILITADMVAEMRPGSVIVDMAAETGGNCELTERGAVRVVNGVTIHGPLGLAGSLPVHASQMYSRNASALLTYLIKDGQVRLDPTDEIVRAAWVTRPAEAVTRSV